MTTIELENETSPEENIGHPAGVTVKRDGTPREGVKEEVVIKILSLIKKTYMYIHIFQMFAYFALLHQPLPCVAILHRFLQP